MDGDTLYSIGELARRTGLTVKTIRFYSDRGLVAPTDRSPAGYRLYGIDAAARLELVRTLRELGLDLPTIRKVVDRELSLPEVAAAHAEALAVQIRVLRLRRAVLTAVAERGSTPEETELMHRLAQLSQDERQRLTDDFLDAVFGGLDAAPAFAGAMRSMTPELPDNPEAEQVQAWVELAEMALDPGFRAVVRQMVQDQAAEQPLSDMTGPVRDIAAAVRDQAGPALTMRHRPGLASGRSDRRGVHGALRAPPRPPRRRRASPPAGDAAGERERPPQGAIPPGARRGQRLVSPGESGSRTRLVRPGSAHPDTAMTGAG